MRDLNYNHLRYFWAVAHEGSLTRAAAHMNLSQSALSVQIQKLEHQMGHPLFARVGRKLVLTEAGQIALDYADTVFKAGDELMSILRGRPLATRQVFRVGALTTLSRNFQLEFLRPLVGRSDVELIVRSGNIRDLLAQLEAHAIDVVLANSAAARTPQASAPASAPPHTPPTHASRLRFRHNPQLVLIPPATPGLHTRDDLHPDTRA
jgi:LysR family transcriptional activator of nhaA